MAKVEGLKALQKQLKKLSKGFRGEKSVTVGYTQNYAKIVHENLQARHAEGKEAKYLINAVARNEGAIIQEITSVTRKTGSIQKGLLAGGLLIQRESQEVVPVDTGALKASAFTSKTSETVKAAAAAFAKGEAKRANTKQKRRTKAADKRTRARRKKR